MRRHISRYKNCVPGEMVKMSEAAILYALDDSRHDVISLHQHLTALCRQVRLVAPENEQTKQLYDTLENAERALLCE